MKEIEQPFLKEDEVLSEVKAASINPVNVKARYSEEVHVQIGSGRTVGKVIVKL